MQTIVLYIYIIILWSLVQYSQEGARSAPSCESYGIVRQFMCVYKSQSILKVDFHLQVLRKKESHETFF